MAEAFTRWDVTEHLRTKEDMRLYLEACVAEDPGDGSLIRAALSDVAASPAYKTEGGFETRPYEIDRREDETSWHQPLEGVEASE